MNYSTGETANGRRMHAVDPTVADGRWTTALCGAEVITYSHVPFEANTTSACAACSRKANA